MAPVRARPCGLCPATNRRVFRIVDAENRRLARIAGASGPAAAIMLYWRRSGLFGTLGTLLDAVVPEDVPEPLKPRRAARGRSAMRTPELSLPVPDAPPPGPKRAGPRRKPVAAPDGQEDLFGRAAEEARPASMPAQADEQEVRPAPDLVPVPAPPTPAVPAPGPGWPDVPDGMPDDEPARLDARDLMLQTVDPRGVRPTDRPDGWLYHVTTGDLARTALRDGLAASAGDPLPLSERPGVPHWLAAVAEDGEGAGGAGLAVLRLRRYAVEDMLEDDPDASRAAGHPCYLLVGPGAAG